MVRKETAAFQCKSRGRTWRLLQALHTFCHSGRSTTKSAVIYSRLDRAIGGASQQKRVLVVSAGI